MTGLARAGVHAANAALRGGAVLVSHPRPEVTRLTDRVDPGAGEQRLIDVFTPKTTAVMTNVPGPREPVDFAGSRVAGVLGWVPAGGEIGMGVSIFSYAGGASRVREAPPSRARAPHSKPMRLRERPGGWTVA